MTYYYYHLRISRAGRILTLDLAPDDIHGRPLMYTFNFDSTEHRFIGVF